MAVTIDDSGGWGYDALLNGVEDTAWSRDETNDLIWFSGTGTSTTGFTLPSATAWIVYEVYDVDSYTNDLTDGTNVYAWIEYTSTIGTIATTLETWKTAWESEATTRGYTTYKIKATHYKTGDVADVYYATEAATDFSKAVADGVEDGDFTGYGAWSISDTMLADGASSLVDVFADLASGLNPDHENGTSTWSYSGASFDLAMDTLETGANDYRRPIIYVGTTATTGDNHELRFDLTVNSGTCSIWRCYGGSGGTWTLDIGEVTTGAVAIALDVGTNADIAIYFDGSVDFDISADNVQVVVV